MSSEPGRTTLSVRMPVGTRTVVIEGRPVTYALFRSDRARHVRLEVDCRAGLKVIIPRPYSIARLAAVLQQKRRWILAKLNRFQKCESVFAGKLNFGDPVPYLGNELRIAAGPDDGPGSIRLDGENMVVSPVLVRDGQLNDVLKLWYRFQARRILDDRAKKWAAQLGVSHNRLSVREQRTRWGSCSHKGNLSFNWKLITVPLPVIDYVVIHELTHIKEMNHSPRFWELVAMYSPEWRQHRQWLKEHEIDLAWRLS